MDIVRRRYSHKKFAELSEEAETQYIDERYDTSKAKKELEMTFFSAWKVPLPTQQITYFLYWSSILN